MIRLGLFAMAIVASLALQPTEAAEPSKATTNELPAALAALGVDQQNILTTSAAHEIRGQGGCFSYAAASAATSTTTTTTNLAGVQSVGGNVLIEGNNKFGVKAKDSTIANSSAGDIANLFGVQSAGGNVFIVGKNKFDVKIKDSFALNNSAGDFTNLLGVQALNGNVFIVGKNKFKTNIKNSVIGKL